MDNVPRSISGAGLRYRYCCLCRHFLVDDYSNNCWATCYIKVLAVCGMLALVVGAGLSGIEEKVFVS